MPVTKTPEPSAIAAFRQLDAAGQIAQLRGQRSARICTVERDGIDKEARTAWLSIASEQPYQRWWGVEILDHGKGAIRDGRLKSGAPLLVGHDTADQVGVVERYEITSSRKLRILARFGRSARAEEIWQDVVDGIRRNTSVGYIIHDLVLESSEDGLNTYRVTDWEPLEGSIVPVPADTTVGVGRQFMKGKAMSKVENEMEQEDGQHQTRSQRRRAAADQQTEAERIESILAAGDQFADVGGVAIARALIADPQATVESFKARMLHSMRGTSKPLNTAEPHHMPYETGARVNERHGELRCFTGRDGAKRAYAFGQFLRAQMPQQEAAVRWCRENGMELRYMSGSSGPDGGYVVSDEISSEIIKNTEEYGVMRQEARVWPMGSDTLSVPKYGSGATAEFTAEDTETTESTPQFGLVNLATREARCKVVITRSLLEDNVISLADYVGELMGEAYALLEDNCGFIGSGTSAYGGMEGISPKLLTATASQVTAATGHDTFPEIDATDLANLMAKLPKYAQKGAKWYMSTAAYGATIMRLLLSAGGNTPQTLEAGGSVASPAFGGFPVVQTPVLPGDTAADMTGKVMMMFGNLRRSTAFGDRRVMSMLVDPYTLAGKGQIRILGWERFHIVNHSVGDASTVGPMVALIGGS